MGPTLDFTETGVHLRFRYAPERFRDGSFAIESQVRFSPVRLLPNESMVVWHRFTVPSVHPVRTVSIDYRVSEWLSVTGRFKTSHSGSNQNQPP
jgi:hypothetical protein